MSSVSNFEYLLKELERLGYFIDRQTYEQDGQVLVRGMIVLHRKDNKSYDNKREWEDYKYAARKADCYIHPDPDGDTSKLHVVGIDHLNSIEKGLTSVSNQFMQSYWVMQEDEEAQSIALHVLDARNFYRRSRKYFRSLLESSNRPDLTNLKPVNDYLKGQDKVRRLITITNFTGYVEYGSMTDTWGL